MTPSLSNPSLPRAKTLALTLPFRGVYRRTPKTGPEGTVVRLDQCQVDNGVIYSLPGFGTTTDSLTRMGWLSVDEEIQGFVRTRSDGFHVFTDVRLEEYPFTGQRNVTALSGTWTKVAPSPIVNGVGGNAGVAGLCYGCKCLISGSWYTLVQVLGANQIEVAETAGSFAGVAASPWIFQSFSYPGQAWYGPRYTYFGDILYICSLYGTLYADTDTTLRPSTRLYRGRDIINFAGRPMLIGAVEATSDYNSTPVPDQYSDLLRWPTRSSHLDWASYGSGYLHSQDDGGNHRAGCVWGEDAYLFTDKSIYRIVATGQSAGNPIALYKFPVKVYEPPLSNVVQGLHGLYYWSTRGPCLFDGKEIIPLYKILEKDADYFDTTLLGQGVWVWVDTYGRSIRFYNKKQQVASLRYIFWEDDQAFTTLNSNVMYLAGLAPHALHTEWFGIDATAIGSSATPVVRNLDELSGTLTEGGGPITPRIHVQGIEFPEGSHVNKHIKMVRIVGVFRGNGDVEVGMIPDTTSGATYDTVSVTGAAQTVQELVFENRWPVEAPVWALTVDFYDRCAIHGIYIDYVLGGDVHL
jgi:hypothetical protein